MRGIKINPTDRTVTEVDVKSPNKSLKSLYELIGCELVELVQLDREVILVCDEEGKMKNITGAFHFYGCPELVIAGNAIILGGNGNRFKVLHENVENIRKIVEWVKPEDVPEPHIGSTRPPPCRARSLQPAMARMAAARFSLRGAIAL